MTTNFDQMQLDRDWIRSRYHRIDMEVVPADNTVLIYLDGELFGSLQMDFLGTEEELVVSWHEWRWVLIEEYKPLGRVFGERRRVEAPS